MRDAVGQHVYQETMREMKRVAARIDSSLPWSKEVEQVKLACARLAQAGVRVSPFIDASREQIDAVIECGAPCIEIHTGHYADAKGEEQEKILDTINDAVAYAHGKGLQVNAGHGLNRHNVLPIAANLQINELNIGHAIVADAVFLGLARAIQDIKRLMHQARSGA